MFQTLQSGEDAATAGEEEARGGGGDDLRVVNNKRPHPMDGSLSIVEALVLVQSKIGIY